MIWSGTSAIIRNCACATIARLDMDQVRQETDRYVRDKSSLGHWSREFFRQIVERIETVAEGEQDTAP